MKLYVCFSKCQFQMVNDSTAKAKKMLKDRGFVKVPEKLGIIWKDDQSNNELTTKLATADYVFETGSDIELLMQYIDQLELMIG